MTKKYKGFRQFTSAIHFHTAVLDKTQILAFQDGELIGSGSFDEMTDQIIKIRDERFMRENCTFVYAK
ncbi:hypothetical protein [Paenibacillus sp. LHD-38]|uniref:hypothetical protein n=1 Tax=Paenibacillus sp. LHD-38 TaxID=3072143 RepID=UPI00280E034E|nr:hypothetical protein [Paenibacillus sp. LHD-38]MDQ8734236.1 hypothetical protein [Paenibacillus sp. LHD-38]